MKKISVEEGLMKILKDSKDGMTITDLVKSAGLSRSTVRVALARLEGGKKVSYKNIGMAKVYVAGVKNGR